jgi:hypothetical protein
MLSGISASFSKARIVLYEVLVFMQTLSTLDPNSPDINHQQSCLCDFPLFNEVGNLLGQPWQGLHHFAMD